MRTQPAFTIIETLLYSLFFMIALSALRAGIVLLRSLARAGQQSLAVNGYHRTAFFYFYRDLTNAKSVKTHEKSIIITSTRYEKNWQPYTWQITYLQRAKGLYRRAGRPGSDCRAIYVAPPPKSVTVTEAGTSRYQLVYCPGENEEWQEEVTAL